MNEIELKEYLKSQKRVGQTWDKLELRVGRGRDDRPPVLLDVNLADPVDVIAEQIYDASLPFLRSTDVQATWDPETRTGKVYAGFHCVGEATVRPL